MVEVKLIETTDDGKVIYSVRVEEKENIMPVDIDNIFKTMDINIKFDSKKSLSYIKCKDKNFYVDHSYDCKEYVTNIVNSLKKNGIKNIEVEFIEEKNKIGDVDVRGVFEAKCSKCGFCTVPYYSLNKIKENYPSNICPDCNRESLKILERNNNGRYTL